MPKIIISGACGRMGREIADIAGQDGFDIVAGVDVRAESYAGFPVYPSFSMVTEAADALIDFSRPETLPALLTFARTRSLPVVLAATGYNETDDALIADAAKDIAVFRSANMSVGVYALKLLAKQAAELLPGFDIEIVEKHHNQKLDAPSGTAMALYSALADDNSRPVYGRSGRAEKREKRDIGVLSVRGGTVTGEHEAGFYGQGETLMITHVAQDRSIFAHGALKAARFAIARQPGQYGMDDLFGAN